MSLNYADALRATPQLWAASYLTVPSAQSVDPFESLNNLLRLYMTQSSVIPLAATSSSTTGHPPSRPSSQPGSDSPNSQAPILNHYQQSLSALVSCGDADSPNSFDFFTPLANSTASTSVRKGFHLSILAWAGKHMVNQGQAKYEAASERLGSQGTPIIMGKLHEYKNGGSAQTTETERMTLLAGVLMAVQFK
jgi:transcriptional activator protein UGA3